MNIKLPPALERGVKELEKRCLDYEPLLVHLIRGLCEMHGILIEEA